MGRPPTLASISSVDSCIAVIDIAEGANLRVHSSTKHHKGLDAMCPEVRRWVPVVLNRLTAMQAWLC